MDQVSLSIVIRESKGGGGGNKYLLGMVMLIVAI
jgi:hypothetical protein